MSASRLPSAAKATVAVADRRASLDGIREAGRYNTTVASSPPTSSTKSAWVGLRGLQLGKKRITDLLARDQPLDDASVPPRSIGLLDGRDVGTRILSQGLASLRERLGLIPGVYVEAVL